VFQTGHYKGQTSQSENFEFDVDFSGVRGLKTGQVNLGCTPPQHLWMYGYDFGAYSIPLATDGSFSYDQKYQSSLTFTDGTFAPTQNELTITGHISGAVALGNLQLHTVYAKSGTVWDCGSGLQTWTATRTS
jgi:hypothetical protein